MKEMKEMKGRRGNLRRGYLGVSQKTSTSVTFGVKVRTFQTIDLKGQIEILEVSLWVY